MITIELLIIIQQFRLSYSYRKNRTIDNDDPVFCGDSWTRTNDPIDVNDVLYRLSHATGFFRGTKCIISCGRDSVKVLCGFFHFRNSGIICRGSEQTDAEKKN